MDPRTPRTHPPAVNTAPGSATSLNVCFVPLSTRSRRPQPRRLTSRRACPPAALRRRRGRRCPLPADHSLPLRLRKPRLLILHVAGTPHQLTGAPPPPTSQESYSLPPRSSLWVHLIRAAPPCTSPKLHPLGSVCRRRRPSYMKARGIATEGQWRCYLLPPALLPTTSRFCYMVLMTLLRATSGGATSSVGFCYMRSAAMLQGCLGFSGEISGKVRVAIV